MMKTLPIYITRCMVTAFSLLGGVIWLLAACSDSLDPLRDEALNPSSATTSTPQHDPAAPTAADTLTTLLPGMWHIAHYYELAAPHCLYTPDDGTRARVTPDSILIYAEQILIDGFGSAPTTATVLTAAYPYLPLPPATLVTGSDTLRLSRTDRGLRIEGSVQGVWLEAMEY